MKPVNAKSKTLRDIDDATTTPEENVVRAFQITEENHKDLGTTVEGYYYVVQSKVDSFLVPEEDFFSVTVELYSDSSILRAEIGDWLVIRPRKYKLEVEWIGKDAFDMRFDVEVEEEPTPVDVPAEVEQGPGNPEEVVDPEVKKIKQ